jgi:hypothetical protein
MPWHFVAVCAAFGAIGGGIFGFVRGLDHQRMLHFAIFRVSSCLGSLPASSGYSWPPAGCEPQDFVGARLIRPTSARTHSRGSPLGGVTDVAMCCFRFTAQVRGPVDRST